MKAESNDTLSGPGYTTFWYPIQVYNKTINLVRSRHGSCWSQSHPGRLMLLGRILSKPGTLVVDNCNRILRFCFTVRACSVSLSPSSVPIPFCWTKFKACGKTLSRWKVFRAFRAFRILIPSLAITEMIYHIFTPFYILVLLYSHLSDSSNVLLLHTLGISRAPLKSLTASGNPSPIRRAPA